MSLYPTAGGRIYATYGVIYVSIVLLWLWGADEILPHLWDFVVVVIMLMGMGIVMFSPR
ncbi:YnfA family protein [Ketobacter alkanivorans]|uniref:hypothetical protein n=1 Tax=Ketobacter alkanivorans TaxID=1917421 RepID=UPI0038991C1C